MTMLLNVLAALAYAIGGAFMKRSEGFTDASASIALYICFAVGATLQTVSLRKQTLGSGYVIVLGLEAVATLALGARLYKEPIDARKAVATLLVAIGVYLLRQ